MKTICNTCKNDCNNAGTTARISWCPQYKPGRILSNADRIRAMSDEELGKFLYGYFWGRLPVLPNREEKLLDWLQQPAEEGD